VIGHGRRAAATESDEQGSRQPADGLQRDGSRHRRRSLVERSGRPPAGRRSGRLRPSPGRLERAVGSRRAARKGLTMH
jgi:hypothetical protein